MPIVQLEGHDYEYPVSDVLRMFYGQCSMISPGKILAGTDASVIVHSSLSIPAYVHGSKETPVDFTG
jgi:hypothetical protein